MIVEKIDDNEHTMRLQRLAGEIDIVFGILEVLSKHGIYLCQEVEDHGEVEMEGRTITVCGTHMSPILTVQDDVYRAFGIDPAALVREEEYRRRRHVSIHGREP